MPTGPNGEKRPADVIANAVHVMKVATGEKDEELVQEPARMGGEARARTLSKTRRQEIARKGAEARWGKDARP